jgi:hypothetical protein
MSPKGKSTDFSHLFANALSEYIHSKLAAERSFEPPILLRSRLRGGRHNVAIWMMRCHGDLINNLSVLSTRRMYDRSTGAWRMYIQSTCIVHVFNNVRLPDYSPAIDYKFLNANSVCIYLGPNLDIILMNYTINVWNGSYGRWEGEIVALVHNIETHWGRCS